MTTPIKYRISSTATKPVSDTVKGAPLTSLEIDGNFRSIKDSIELIQSAYLPAGYNAPVDYVAGVILSSATQTVAYQGEVYAPKAAELPFTTSGVFEVAKFVQIRSVASVDLTSSGGSALVGYIPAGTGAVATTVEQKLRENVSTNDYENYQAPSDSSVALQKTVDQAFSVNAVAKNQNTTSARIAASSVKLRPGLLQGAGFLPLSPTYKTGGVSKASNAKITINSPLRSGYEQDSLAAKDPNNWTGWYNSLQNLALEAGDATKPILVNNESHFMTLDGVSFRGNQNTGVPKVRLGATLYTKVNRCDLGGTGNGIEAKESTWDAAYYGTNFSHIKESNFNCTGTAAHLHGIFSVRDSAIEQDAETLPHFILGESGKSVAARSVLDFNYFECKTKTTATTVQPLVELQSDQRVVMTNNIMTNINSTHSDGDNTTLVKSVNYQQYFVFNYNDCRPTTPTKGKGTAVNITTAADSYVEAVGNFWNVATTPDYTPSNMFVINGSSVIDKSISDATYPRNRVYIRDLEHGERRQNIPQVDLWCRHNGGKLTRALRVDSSRHLLVTAQPAVNSSATAFKVSSVDGGGGITAVSLTGAYTGDSYINGENVTIKNGVGVATATGTVTTKRGYVVGLTVTTAGSGYAVNDTLTLETTDNEIQVIDKEKWIGAEFVVHFTVGVTLKHGAKYFQLSAGRDIYVPAGSMMTFAVDYQGYVRDVSRCIVYGSKTYDWPSLANGSQQSTTVTATGTKLGDFVNVNMSVPLLGTRMWAEVTADNTVTVYHRNDTGATVDIASGTLSVQVTK